MGIKTLKLIKIADGRNTGAVLDGTPVNFSAWFVDEAGIKYSGYKYSEGFKFHATGKNFGLNQMTLPSGKECWRKVKAAYLIEQMLNLIEENKGPVLDQAEKWTKTLSA